MSAAVNMPIVALRASALPFAFACPGSVRDGGLRVDEMHQASAVGTAAHELLRAVAETGAADWDRVQDVADEYGADADEVRLLVGLGAKLWRDLQQIEPHHNPVSELSLRADVMLGVTLHGHPDVVATGDGGVALICDWKTGHCDATYREQMRAYAVLVMLDDAGVNEVRARVLWVRNGEVELYTMRRTDIPEWLERLSREVVAWDGTYRPGPHCTHCPRAHDCPAANALVRRDVAILREVPDVLDLTALTPAQRMALYNAERTVSVIVERVHKALSAAVKAGLPVEGDGERLEIQIQHKRVIDVSAAWPVLTEAGFGDAEFARVLTAHAGEIDTVVKERAPRGKGAAAIRQINEQLEAVGAVRRVAVEKVVKRRMT